MRKLTAAILLVVLATACSKKGELYPEAICSSDATYSEIISTIAGQVGQVSVTNSDAATIAAASSKRALGGVLTFLMPLVDFTNKETGKISCSALMQISAPEGYQNDLELSSLEVNERARNHVQVRIHYSIQPSADGGHRVLTLDQGGDLAVVALHASILNSQRIQKAAGTTPAQDFPPDDEEAPLALYNDADQNSEPDNLLDQAAAGSNAL